MDGSHRPEVTLIKSRQLRLFEPLRQGQYARIDDPKGEVEVPGLEVTAATQIRCGRRFDAIGACDDVVEEDQPGVGRKATGAPVVEFRQHERWHHQVLGSFGQECCTAAVVGIRCVERCKKRPRIEDERHSARLFRNGFAREFGSAGPIGGAPDADPWAPARAQGPRLFLDSFPKQRGNRHTAAGGFRLERPERCGGCADRRPPNFHLDA